VTANAHPAVMFELIAHDQAALQAFYTAVFGWTYRIGTGGFAYIDFPTTVRPLLGGIGKAQAGVPGFEPGHNFYLLVDSLEATIAAAEHAGGELYMPIAAVDGYRFAMIADPEGNPVGLIEPFAATDPVSPVMPIEPGSIEAVPSEPVPPARD
jgi:predicted enzyme related to lactoylglutathione lyase